jgi:UPF0716 family protein affecting phage T7 exclusion
MDSEHRDVLPFTPETRRRSWARAVFLFVSILLVSETALFFVVSRYVSWNILLGVSALTGVMGLIVMGVAVVHYGRAIAAKLDRDESLGKELSNGLLMMVAGVLLLCPGFISDVLALILLVPQSRRYVLGAVTRYFGPFNRDSLPAAQYPHPMPQAAAADDGDEELPARIIKLPERTRAA